MKAALILLSSLLLAACASTMQARSDFDPAQDFSAYRSFAWMQDAPLVVPPGTTSTVSPLNRRRIISAIEAELGTKGFQQVADGASADFVLAFTAGARDRLDVQAYPSPYRGVWPWGRPYFGSDVDVDSYQEGTLAIDVFDGTTHQPVWHGRASKRITQNDVEGAAELIPRAVAAILADFPPRDR
jgi:hypothetical protein